MSKPITLVAILTPVPGKDAYRVGVEPPHNWSKVAHYMEVVGVLANDFVGNNPKGIDSAEDMADYVSEYITKVIMGASK